MCPCPFCTTVAILLCPLLLFPATRKWLKSKIKKHHCGCDVCQKAEHQQHLADHTPCHCQACQAATVSKSRQSKAKGIRIKARAVKTSKAGKKRTTRKTRQTRKTQRRRK